VGRNRLPATGRMRQYFDSELRSGWRARIFCTLTAILNPRTYSEFIENTILLVCIIVFVKRLSYDFAAIHNSATEIGLFGFPRP
jgi:hypothetical protein